MQTPGQNAPEMVVEELQASNNLLRAAIIALGALTLLVCACFALFLAYNQYSQNQALALANVTATRTRVFAATWTPTATDTPEPTGTPRPTATPTNTPTATPPPTDTPPEPTDTNTPRAPTNTPRPRPTNTPRPRATNTPVPPPPAPTNTPVPSFAYRITSQISYKNEGSMGVFGTVRDRNGNLVVGMYVCVLGSAGHGYAAPTTTRSDRNYEVSSTANGLPAGQYTVYLASSSSCGNAQQSPAVSINITPLDSGSTQWWGINFQQN
jgi:hypothetical protein